MWRLGDDPLSPLPFILHFAVFGVLSGSLARSWRHLTLAVIGVNVFYTILTIQEFVHYKLKDYRYSLLNVRQALEWVVTDQETYLALGLQLFATASCGIVIFWLRQVLTKKAQWPSSRSR
jgi:hypothetical protein